MTGKPQKRAAPQGAAARITALEKQVATIQATLDELVGAIREAARKQILAQLQATAPAAQPLLSNDQLEQVKQELLRRLQDNGALPPPNGAAASPLAGLAGLGGT